MKVRLVVSINAAPGKGAELALAFRQRCAEVMKEPGCEQFEVFQSVLDPDKLTLLELWSDQAARPCRQDCGPTVARARTTNTSASDDAAEASVLKASYFETGRYQAPADLPAI